MLVEFGFFFAQNFVYVFALKMTETNNDESASIGRAKIVLFYGPTGSGRTTLASQLYTRLSGTCSVVSEFLPAIASIVQIVGGNAVDYLDRGRKRSLALNDHGAKKSYQSLLADYVVAVRLSVVEWCWAANLLRRIDEEHTQNRQLRLFVVDDAAFAEDAEWMEKHAKNFRVVKVLIDGNPSNMADESGEYVDELMNNDYKNLDKFDIEINTDSFDVQNCTNYLIKQLEKIK